MNGIVHRSGPHRVSDDVNLVGAELEEREQLLSRFARSCLNNRVSLDADLFSLSVPDPNSFFADLLDPARSMNRDRKLFDPVIMPPLPGGNNVPADPLPFLYDSHLFPLRRQRFGRDQAQSVSSKDRYFLPGRGSILKNLGGG